MDDIISLFEAHGGTMRTQDLKNMGVSLLSVEKLIEQGLLERVQYGVYTDKKQWDDELYLFSLRCKKGIYSHDTALYLHGLNDRAPLTFYMTLPSGYNPYRFRGEAKFYYIAKDLHEMGLMQMNSPFGRNIPVYDLDRTVCDILRNESRLDAFVFSEAMKGYVRSEKKNLMRLREYAKALRVYNKLGRYLKVLL